jgi:hypothetical protein
MRRESEKQVIKEALEYLSNLQTLKNPQTVVVGGNDYAVKADGTLGEVVRKPDLRASRPTLALSTLSGLVAAYKAEIDLLGKRAAIHVADVYNVKIFDLDADEFGKRVVYAHAQHVVDTKFVFDKFMELEDFLLAFRSSFFFNDQAVKIVQLCSMVGAGNAVTVSDDGISQEVVTKSGTITKAPVTLPADGVPLIPWRTFRDANPVESRFLLRMRGVKDGLPQIALFEIDAKWKLDTIASIKSYLAAELPDATIIA